MRLREFHRFILPEVIGCPEPTLDLALLQTAYDFCDKSGVWDEIQDPQTIQAGVADYDIDRPSEGIMLRVREVWVDDRAITFMPIREVNQMSLSSGSPVYYNAAADRSQIRLYPTPSETGQSLKVRAVYAPTMTATALPDVLFNRYIDGIASGTKARLMAMSGAGITWSNPQMAGVYLTRFNEVLVDARIESLHENVEGSLQAAPRPFHIRR